MLNPIFKKKFLEVGVKTKNLGQNLKIWGKLCYQRNENQHWSL